MSNQIKRIAAVVSAACAFGFAMNNPAFAAGDPLQGLQEKLNAAAAKAGVAAPDAAKELLGKGVAKNTDTPKERVRIEKMVQMDTNAIRAVKASDGTIMFIFDNGRFMLTGDMLDIWNRKHLKTIEDIEDAVTHIDLRRMGFQLDKTNHITVGEGKSRATIFVDARCPWCHKLLKIVADDPELFKQYTFDIVVLTVLGEESRRVGEKFACAKASPMEKFNALVKGPRAIRALPQDEACNPRDLMRSTDLQQRAMQLISVPFIIAPDKRFSKGMPENLRNFLDAGKAAEAARKAEQIQQEALRKVEQEGPLAAVTDETESIARKRVPLNKEGLRPVAKPQPVEAKAPQKETERYDLGKFGYDPSAVNHISIGTGAEHLTVFVDPQCGWCHRLASEILDDEEVLARYTVDFVLVDVLGDQSRALAEQLECSNAPAKEKLEAFIDGKDAIDELSKSERCSRKLTRGSKKLRRKMNLSGVPFIVTPDGRTINGKPKDLHAALGMDKPAAPKVAPMPAPKAAPAPAPSVHNEAKTPAAATDKDGNRYVLGPSDQDTEFDAAAKGFDLAKTNHFTVGEGDKEVMMFVDPQCGWCHRLLEDVDDEADDLFKEFKIHFVVQSMLGDESRKLATLLACAKATPREKFNAMLEGADAIRALEQMPRGECNRKVVRSTQRMSDRLGVQAVPFILTHDKRIARGKPADIAWFLSARYTPEQLEQRAKERAEKAKAEKKED